MTEQCIRKVSISACDVYFFICHFQIISHLFNLPICHMLYCQKFNAEFNKTNVNNIANRLFRMLDFFMIRIGAMLEKPKIWSYFCHLNLRQLLNKMTWSFLSQSWRYWRWVPKLTTHHMTKCQVTSQSSNKGCLGLFENILGCFTKFLKLESLPLFYF